MHHLVEVVVDEGTEHTVRTSVPTPQLVMNIVLIFVAVRCAKTAGVIKSSDIV